MTHPYPNRDAAMLLSVVFGVLPMATRGGAPGTEAPPESGAVTSPEGTRLDEADANSKVSPGHIARGISEGRTSQTLTDALSWLALFFACLLGGLIAARLLLTILKREKRQALPPYVMDGLPPLTRRGATASGVGPDAAALLRDRSIARALGGKEKIRLRQDGDAPAQGQRLDRLAAHAERDLSGTSAAFAQAVGDAAASEHQLAEAAWLASRFESTLGVTPLLGSLPASVTSTLGKRAVTAYGGREPEAGDLLSRLLVVLDAPLSGLGLLGTASAAALSRVPDEVVLEALRVGLGLRLGACLLGLLPAARVGLLLRGIDGLRAQKLLATLAQEGPSYALDDASQVLAHFSGQNGAALARGADERLARFCDELMSHLAKPQREAFAESLRRPGRTSETAPRASSEVPFRFADGSDVGPEEQRNLL
jgi:hypothetical protein